MYDLFSLCAEDIAGMADRAAVETMTVAREAVCRDEAAQVRAIARLAQIRGHTRWVADEMALELCMSRQAAYELADACVALTTRLPKVLAAMDSGEVNLDTAKKICQVTSPLSDEKCREADERIAARIIGKDSEQARWVARDVVQTIDPDGCNERAQKRREDRNVQFVPGDEGMASLWAYFPAEVASASYARVDAIAHKLKTKDEERTLDQLRADVLADLLLG